MHSAIIVGRVRLARVLALLALLPWRPLSSKPYSPLAASDCQPLAPAATVRFAVIGDYGLQGEAEAAVAAEVHGWQPDLILTVGDDNYPLGAAETIDPNIGQYYHDFICPYVGGSAPGAASNRFLPAMGNHDWYTVDPLTGWPPYLAYFQMPGNERYYDVVQGPVHFFIVDSDANEPDGISAASVQAQWLHAGLQASVSPWNIVFLHHAPYSSGSGHGSSPTLQWPYQQWGADAVLAGHDHTYERIVMAGFPYFVDGLGGSTRYPFGIPVDGSQVRYSEDFGAMLVDASASYISFRFITQSGLLIDTYSLSKGRELRSDFDSDRKADPLVFAGATGNWFVVGSLTGFAAPALNFGNEADYIPVAGDYDGDGTTDPAVFEKATGNWFVVGSSRGFFTPALDFGNDTGYIPVPADYDGDGKTDPAVYSRSTGNWFVVGSQKGFYSPALAFGGLGYAPLPGDYDGDGKSDAAVFQSSSGNWFAVGSTTGFFAPALNFGAGDKYLPVPGDYDGDGRLDPAVFSKAAGNWHVVGSRRGYFKPALGFGNDADYIPQPADYDGDGLTDPAVYGRTTGNWFVVGSTRGFFAPALGFGNSSFIPLVWQPRQ